MSAIPTLDPKEIKEVRDYGDNGLDVVLRTGAVRHVPHDPNNNDFHTVNEWLAKNTKRR